MSKEWVEIGNSGLVIRIFRTKKAAVKEQLVNPDCVVTLMQRNSAVGQIRQQVFERDEWRCVHCGEEIDIETGEMDERQARGECVETPDGDYQSGEVSVANCQALCRNCHTGPGGKHDRAPSFSKGPQCSVAGMEYILPTIQN